MIDNISYQQDILIRNFLRPLPKSKLTSLAPLPDLPSSGVFGSELIESSSGDETDLDLTPPTKSDVELVVDIPPFCGCSAGTTTGSGPVALSAEGRGTGSGLLSPPPTSGNTKTGTGPVSVGVAEPKGLTTISLNDNPEG